MLEGEPGQRYNIRNDRPEQDEEAELATADEDGVIRDSQGRSYSDGAYEIIKELDND